MHAHDQFTHTSRAITVISKFNASLVSQNFCGKTILKRGNFLSKVILNDEDILIPQDVKKNRNCSFNFFSGVTALKAFCQTAEGVSNCPCRYKGINGVLLNCYRCEGQLRHYTGKKTAYSQKISTMLFQTMI